MGQVGVQALALVYLGMQIARGNRVCETSRACITLIYEFTRLALLNPAANGDLRYHRGRCM